MSNRAIYLVTAITACFAGFSPTWAAKESDYNSLLDNCRLQPKPCPARCLKFPDVDLGVVLIKPNQLFASEPDDVVSKAKPVPARGTVNVPADSFVTYCPNGNFYKNPQLLTQLPANAFDGLVFRFIAIDDQEVGRGDRGLQAMSRFKTLRIADLEKADFSDESLASLKECRDLEILQLYGTDLRGHFLKELTSCQKLKVLFLPYTDIDKRYLHYLNKYPQLCKLNLVRSGVDAVALAPLKDCKNLSSLDLSANAGIKDDIVPLALSMKQLKFLYLGKTNVSSEARKKLEGNNIITNKGHLAGKDHKEKNRLKNHKKKNENDVEIIFGPVSRGRKL